MRMLLALASVVGTQVLPAWSHDGTRIAWMAAPLDNVPSPVTWEIWGANADGSGAHKILGGGPLAEGASQLDWLPGGSLTFVGNFSVFVVSPGGRPKRLAVNIGDEASHDADGVRFAFASSTCGQNLCPSKIVVLDRRSESRTFIGGSSTRYYDPTISPDGRRVAFTSPDGLDVASVGVGAVHRIVPGPAGCPYWSPDGQRIAYIGFGGSLRMVSVAGGSSIVLADRVGCGYAPLNDGWSPDGTRLAVEIPGGRLTIVDVASRKRHTLTAFRYATGFAWSPDSSKLLVSARPRPFACSSLWVVNAVGTDAHRVVSCGS